MDMMITYMSNHPIMTLLMILWIIAWKLIALWKAAKHNNLTIFIVIGVVNTMGIMEIIYLSYLYFKDKKGKTVTK